MLTSFVIVVVIMIILVYRKKDKKKVLGKLALVTGGGNGLGQQICLKLAAVGCNVAIADVDFPSAQRTAASLVKMGVSAKAYKVDVSNYSEITQLKQNILNDLGEVDILVNNAGLIPYKTIFEQSAEDLERLTKVNFNSVMLMTKCFLENMIERKTGHVVAIASLQGIYPFPHSLAYCATKFGVTGFMLGLIEYLRLNKLSKVIHATCVAPNVIGTRDDIIKAVNPKFTVLMAESVATLIVDALLKNERFLTIPFHYGWAISIFNVFPFWIQHLIRDYAYQEAKFLADPSV